MTNPSFPTASISSVVIEAEPETVFKYFSDSERWASWWGKGFTIEPRVGGRVFILHPGGVEVSGEVTDVEPPQRIAFTYGYATGIASLAETSLVTIVLNARGVGPRASTYRMRLPRAPCATSTCRAGATSYRFLAISSPPRPLPVRRRSSTGGLQPV